MYDDKKMRHMASHLAWNYIRSMFSQEGNYSMISKLLNQLSYFKRKKKNETWLCPLQGHKLS